MLIASAGRAAPALAQTTTQVTEVGAAEQEPTSAEAINDLPQPSFWEGGGVRISEGTILHPAFAVSGGYQSNVFFQAASDGPSGPMSAALAQFSIGASYGTLTQGRLDIEAPGDDTGGPRLVFGIDAQLIWNQYFAAQKVITDQSDLGVGLNADFKLNPRGKVVLELRDAFLRSVLPGQSLREDSDRDRNELTATATFRPGGGAIEIDVGYQFIVDVFESSILLFEDRLSHAAIAAARWNWLPRTQFVLEGSLATVNPSNDTLKSSSMPLHVWGGVSTLFTPAVGLVVRGGYGNGFYDTGESVSTWLARVEGRFAVGPTLRAAAGYDHDFADALVGNFYLDHHIYGRIAWQLLERLQLRLAAEVRFRSYGGIRDVNGLELCGDAGCGKFRNDVLGRVDAVAEYQFTRWLFGSVSYTLMTDSTDFFVRSAQATDSGAYVANSMMASVSARF